MPSQSYELTLFSAVILVVLVTFTVVAVVFTLAQCVYWVTKIFTPAKNSVTDTAVKGKSDETKKTQ